MIREPYPQLAGTHTVPLALPRSPHGENSACPFRADTNQMREQIIFGNRIACQQYFFRTHCSLNYFCPKSLGKPTLARDSKYVTFRWCAHTTSNSNHAAHRFSLTSVTGFMQAFVTRIDWTACMSKKDRRQVNLKVVPGGRADIEQQLVCLLLSSCPTPQDEFRRLMNFLEGDSSPTPSLEVLRQLEEE